MGSHGCASPCLWAISRETWEERTQDILTPQCSVRFLLEELELEDWLQLGLAIAVNGQKVGEDHALNESDEVALLPPVSGG